MERRRRWHLTEKEAVDHARSVGGLVGHATVGNRPDRSKGFHTDWLVDGPESPRTEWVPQHLFSHPSAPRGS